MQQRFEAENLVDGNGRPAGGYVKGIGLDIQWQDGPLGAPDDPDRAEPNGAFVETVIASVLQRIEHYNETQFHCKENDQAIAKLESALEWLNRRTQRRVDAGVEGTHEGS